jgi:hypothetical protein
VGGYPHTINTRLQMVCTFMGTFCKYTTRIMRSSLMLLVRGFLLTDSTQLNSTELRLLNCLEVDPGEKLLATIH